MLSKVTYNVLWLCLVAENTRLIFKLITKMESTKQTLNEAENGNKSKPLLAEGWISVNDRRPNENQTVWCYSENTFNIFVGAYIYLTNEGWFWASSNGCFYIEEGKIITECEIDDLDVTHWFPAPVL